MPSKAVILKIANKTNYKDYPKEFYKLVSSTHALLFYKGRLLMIFDTKL
jgi:hypothetical protein